MRYIISEQKLDDITGALRHGDKIRVVLIYNEAYAVEGRVSIYNKKEVFLCTDHIQLKGTGIENTFGYEYAWNLNHISKLSHIAYIAVIGEQEDTVVYSGDIIWKLKKKLKHGEPVLVKYKDREKLISAKITTLKSDKKAFYICSDCELLQGLRVTPRFGYKYSWVVTNLDSLINIEWIETFIKVDEYEIF